MVFGSSPIGIWRITMADITFQTALKRFVAANRNAMKYAVACSQLALQHYYEHGDTAYIQQFWNAMTQNWNRRSAFATWIVTFSDAILEDNVWKKDKSDKHVVVTEEMKQKAMEKSFFDFVPEKAITTFKAEDIQEAIRKLVARFEGDKMKPESDAAVTYLKDVKAKLRREGLLDPEATSVMEEAKQLSEKDDNTGVVQEPKAEAA